MFIVAPPKVAHGYCIRGLSQNHVRRLFAQSIGQQRSYAKDVAGVETEKERTKREIRDEIERGYFGDVREYNKLNGKLFAASKELRPIEKSGTCPQVSATTLNGSHVELEKALAGKVTLLCVGCRDFAMPQLKTFVEPFEEYFDADDKYQTFQLSLVDKWAWRMFSPLMRSSLRGTVPESQWDRFAICTSGVEPAKKSFGITNSLFGYVYLVDMSGHIRWKAAGNATPAEIDIAKTLAKKLAKMK